MKICCKICHCELDYNDSVIMDNCYDLYHSSCFKATSSHILEIDKYKNILDKYWLLKI